MTALVAGFAQERATAPAKHENADTPQGKEAASGPDLDAIIAKVEQRQAQNHANAPAYTVVREYELFGSDPEKSANSEVKARIDFLPPNKSSYQILESQGSGRGLNVVRHVLDSEAEMRRDPQQHGLTRQNYKFSYQGERELEGRRCYVLGLEPQRKSQDLIQGQAWIDAETYQVRMVDGEPAKSPSWWVKKLHVNLKYGDMDGVWTSKATRAVADVHLFGQHVFTSRAVSGQVGSTVAMNRVPQERVATPVRADHHGRRMSTIVGAEILH